MVFTPSRPSVGSARKEEGENPRVQRDRGRRHRAGGVTPVEQYTGPAVKTSNPGLAPRGAERAVGGIRAWGENPAAGPAHLRLYSHWRRLRERISKVARTSPRASAGSRQPPPGRPPTGRAEPWNSATRRPQRECGYPFTPSAGANRLAAARTPRSAPASANATSRLPRPFRTEQAPPNVTAHHAPGRA